MSVAALANRTVNECIEDIVSKAIIFGIFLKALGAHTVTLTRIHLYDTFAFNAIEQVFELLVFGIVGRFNVGLSGASRFARRGSCHTKGAIHRCSSTRHSRSSFGQRFDCIKSKTQEVKSEVCVRWNGYDGAHTRFEQAR